MIYRELSESEFGSVPAEALGGYKLVPGLRVMAAFDGSEIVGIWVTTYALHAEPVWVREDHRKSPTILRRMWGGVKGIVRDLGAGGIVAIIPDSVPATKRMADVFGFEPLPGAIYLWLDKEKRTCLQPF